MFPITLVQASYNLYSKYVFILFARLLNSEFAVEDDSGITATLRV